jgi:ABC-type transport system substrate-binding protein
MKMAESVHEYAIFIHYSILGKLAKLATTWLNRGYVNDPKMTAMLKEQRRTKDLEARRKIIYEFQRYEAEQQYYVYTNSAMFTGSWQPYVKNYAPNQTFDYGSRAAALWLER